MVYLNGKPAYKLDNASLVDHVVEERHAGAVGGGRRERPQPQRLLVGVDRVGHAEALRAHGADVVVPDLDRLLDGGAA